MAEDKHKDQIKKVVLTGGHAGTTAIATVEAYKKNKNYNNRELHWIGPRRTMEGSRRLSFEFRVLPEMGVNCWGIVSGKVQSKFTRYSLSAMLKIPAGFVHAFWLLVKIRPAVVLSFGGYAAVPVVFWAWVLRIPVVIHEQIAAAGLGNRMSAPFAKKIAVSRKTSFVFFPRKKVVLVGNPILSSIAAVEPKKKIPKIPIIYIQGGSRGAVRINRVVEEVLEELLSVYKVVHQTGELDFERFKDLRGRLSLDLRGRYECFAFCSPFEVYKIYERADIVVGRSGANTVSEVLAAGRPGIFIPIPWSIFNEQERNARYAAKVGMARVLREEDLTPGRLFDEIGSVVADWKKMSEKGFSRKATFDEGAAESLVGLVEGEMG